MRFFKFVILIAFTVILASCNKGKPVDPCNYALSYLPTDTAFYISCEINGVACKYYQMGHFGNTSTLIIAYDGHKAVLNCRSAAEFTELPSHGESSETSSPPPTIRLLFQSVQTIEGKGQIKQLHEIVRPRYAFTYANKTEMFIKDTVYMQGVAIDIATTYSTENIMDFFEYNYPVIYQEALEPLTNYMEITHFEQVCDEVFILEGNFICNVMEKVEKPEDEDAPLPTPTYIRVANGHFRLLSR
ncbi:MAG: hypothetical protein LBF89_04950 [Bacteroidales bacterium]|nr:hypothetical protein [Bacteroidales bacterium]